MCSASISSTSSPAAARRGRSRLEVRACLLRFSCRAQQPAALERDPGGDLLVVGRQVVEDAVRLVVPLLRDPVPGRPGSGAPAGQRPQLLRLPRGGVARSRTGRRSPTTSLDRSSVPAFLASGSMSCPPGGYRSPAGSRPNLRLTGDRHRRRARCAPGGCTGRGSSRRSPWAPWSLRPGSGRRPARCWSRSRRTSAGPAPPPVARSAST